MKAKKLRITEKDFLKANRIASRQEEIQAHGRQSRLGTVPHKSKKIYDRNQMKNAAIKIDDSFFCGVGGDSSHSLRSVQNDGKVFPTGFAQSLRSFAHPLCWKRSFQQDSAPCGRAILCVGKGLVPNKFDAAVREDRRRFCCHAMPCELARGTVATKNAAELRSAASNLL